MRSLEEVATDSPDVRLTFTNQESASMMLLSAATEAGVDLEDNQVPLHDVSDGDALDRLFAKARAEGAERRCITLLELWDRTFVIDPEAVEVYC